MLDVLESRRLLAVSFVRGTLGVVGTDGPDRIAVVYTPAGVEAYVNGVREGIWAGRKIERVEMTGLAGKDWLYLESPDTLLATLRGNGGNDILIDGSATSRLEGGPGFDRINAGSGSDHLLGGANPDTLDGSYGSDTLEGGGGHDHLIGWFHSDDFSGGPGIDTVIYGPDYAAVRVTFDDLPNDGTRSSKFGVWGMPDPYSEGDNVRSDVENIVGTNFEDTITGSGGDNVLIGLGGPDHIAGGGGTDSADNDPADWLEGIDHLL